MNLFDRINDNCVIEKNFLLLKLNPGYTEKGIIKLYVKTAKAKGKTKSRSAKSSY